MTAALTNASTIRGDAVTDAYFPAGSLVRYVSSARDGSSLVRHGMVLWCGLYFARIVYFSDTGSATAEDVVPRSLLSLLAPSEPVQPSLFSGVGWLV